MNKKVAAKWEYGIEWLAYMVARLHNMSRVDNE
jgi:hypothetical protein